jgi:hypothetical protein
VKALARAHRWRRMLEAGEFGTVRELAKAERVNETYICRVLRLTLLAPDIVEAILDGRQGSEITLPWLMEGVAVGWEGQYYHSPLCCRAGLAPPFDLDEVQTNDDTHLPKNYHRLKLPLPEN